MNKQQQQQQQQHRLNSCNNTITFFQRYRPWILFVYSFVCGCLVSGLVYGYPALRRELLLESSSSEDDKQQQISEQSLAIIFTCGSWSSQGGRFFVGLARDRYGTRNVIGVCFILVILGLVGIGLSEPKNTIALSLSLFLTGFGSGIQLCFQPVAGLFPNRSGTVLSSLSGAFQVSCLVFLGLTSIDDEYASASRQTTFVSFATCLAILGVGAVLLCPKGGSFVLHDDDDDAVDDQRSQFEAEEEESEETTSEEQEEEELSSNALMDQIKSLEYILLVVWFSISMIPIHYYIGSIGCQFEAKGDDEGHYTNIFAIIYATSAIISPGAGWLSDTYGLGITQGIATTLVSLSLFVLSVPDDHIPLHGPGHIIGIICFSTGCMFVYGMFFANIGSRLGYTNYGTLAGAGLLISAIVTLAQSPLIAMAATTSSKTTNNQNGLHSNAAIVNISCGVILLGISLPYCFWLHRQEHHHHAEQQPRVDCCATASSATAHKNTAVDDDDDETSSYCTDDNNDYGNDIESGGAKLVMILVDTNNKKYDNGRPQRRRSSAVVIASVAA